MQINLFVVFLALIIAGGLAFALKLFANTQNHE